MAAKGAESKEKIVQKILDTFEGAFPYEKEIRIPMVENGEEIEIKVTLTCAKVNVGDGAMHNAKVTIESIDFTKDNVASVIEPTEQEKENVKNLLARLNL